MYGCELCDHQAPSVAARANHVRWKHKREQSQRTCKRCGDQFDAPNFKAHTIVCGTKEHECEAGCGVVTRNARFCSKSCSARVNNTAGTIGYARYRARHDITRKKTYRDVCFETWPEACAICGWKIAIDVHHIDEVHSNDDPKNLIPLCQNHHLMTRMKEHRADMLHVLTALVKERESV